MVSCCFVQLRCGCGTLQLRCCMLQLAAVCRQQLQDRQVTGVLNGSAVDGCVACMSSCCWGVAPQLRQMLCTAAVFSAVVGAGGCLSHWLVFQVAEQGDDPANQSGKGYCSLSSGQQMGDLFRCICSASCCAESCSCYLLGRPRIVL